MNLNNLGLGTFCPYRVLWIKICSRQVLWLDVATVSFPSWGLQTR